MPYTQNQIRCLTGMGIVPWVTRSADQTDQAVAALVEVVVVSEQAAVVNTPEAAPPVTHQAISPTQVQNTTQPRAETVASASASAAVAASAPMLPRNAATLADQTDFMQTPLVEIPFRGQRCTQLGKSAAPLLILVEATSSQQSQYPFEPVDAKIFEDMLRAIAWRRQDVCLGVLPPSAEPWLTSEDDGPRVNDLCKAHRDAVLLFRQSVPVSQHADDLIVPLERAGMLAWQLPHPALLRESPARKRQAWNVLKAARARLS